MGALDGAMPGVAKTLISVMGATVTYVREAPGSYDPISGDHSGPTTTTWSVKVAPPDPYRQFEINSSQGTILRGDLRTLLAASGLEFVPTPSTDYLRIGSDRLRVIASSPIHSGDSVVAYDLQCRRA